MDPAFCLMRFPPDGELDFYLKKWFYLLENDSKSPFCGSHISTHALPLDGELDFYLKNDLFFIF